MKKITTNTKTLLNAVANANNYTSKDGEFEGIVTIVGRDSILEVKAQNHEQTIVFKNISYASSDLTDADFGEISLDGKKLATVLKVSKSEEVLIEINKESITLKSGRSRVKIDTLAKHQEIEIVQSASENIPLSIEQIAKMYHSIDTNNPKYELNGMLVEVHNKSLNLVSTDTKRLTVASSDSDMNDLRIVIPRHAVSTLTKLFNEEDAIMQTDETQFSVHSHYVSYASKLINGKFPEYQRIVPKQFKQSAEIDTEILKETLIEASMFESDILIAVKNQTLTVRDYSGNTEVEVPLGDSVYLHTDFHFGVNAKYVLEFIGAINNSIIELSVNEFNTPFVLSDKNGCIEVVMPLVDLPFYMEEEQLEAA